MNSMFYQVKCLERQKIKNGVWNYIDTMKVEEGRVSSM